MYIQCQYLWGNLQNDEKGNGGGFFEEIPQELCRASIEYSHAVSRFSLITLAEGYFRVDADDPFR